MSTPPTPPPPTTPHTSKVALPAHVWARFDDGWRPAILLRWIQQGNGTWMGEVAAADDAGDAARFLFAANLLRPCPQPAPTDSS